MGLRSSKPSVPVAQDVDLGSFMGDWYVIAAIGIAAVESDAFDSLEQYQLAQNGTVDVTFSWRPGSATAPVKTTKLKGFVSKRSNAVWAVQPFWPVRAEYLIAHVADDYSTTIIARSARDYVWIMARTPSIDASVKGDLLAKTKALGYDVAKLRDVPQAPR